MEGGPPCFPRDFACPAVLPGPRSSQTTFAYGTLTHSGRPFQQRSASDLICNLMTTPAGWSTGPSNPTCATTAVLARTWFRLLPFRSPLLREYSLFLPLLRCFSSRTYLTQAYLVQPGVTGHYPGWVSPFGHPRINACSLLPEAFRCLPRPSSALGAKASTSCPV